MPAEFVAVTVKLYAPEALGVPVIAPVVASRDSPAGSVPAVTAYVGAGLPSAAMTSEYDSPSVIWPSVESVYVLGATAGAAAVVENDTAADVAPTPYVFIPRSRIE